MAARSPSLKRAKRTNGPNRSNLYQLPKFITATNTEMIVEELYTVEILKIFGLGILGADGQNFDPAVL